MSTPTAQGSKPTPRSTATATAFTPAASSPPRSVHSPAYLPSASGKAATKSPHKTPATAHAAHLAAAAASTPGLNGQTPTHPGPPGPHTPTPLGGAAPSPYTIPDGARSRGTTLKSRDGSSSGDGPAPALSGLAGLGLLGPHGPLIGGNGGGGGGGAGGSGVSTTVPLGGLDGAVDVVGAAGEDDGASHQQQHARTAEQLAQRTRAIAALLATRWGRVSQASLVACVPRLGLEGMWEDGLSDDEVLEGKRRNYIIAGKSFSVEIDWLAGRVEGVVLDLPNARPAAKRTLGRAAAILRRDLVGWHNEAETGQYVDLKRFAENLQQLARTDQLGVEKASCFEALEGLFVSLNKIWEWELSNLYLPPLQEDPRANKAAELRILCLRTGRPTMHANRRIGLKLDYWLDRRRAFLSTYTKPEGPPDSEDEAWGKHDRLFSLLLECQACDPTQYPPIRISEDWVADPVGAVAEAAMGLSGAVAWVEPPVLMIANADAPPEPEADAMDIDAAIRQATHSAPPAVRFMAKLDPPVVVAWTTAAQIFQLVQQPMDPDMLLQPYLALLFAETMSDGNTGHAASITEDGEALVVHRSVPAFAADGTPQPHRTSYRLTTSVPLVGVTLHEIPFAHPSQLVTMLPVLRQWAHLGQLLRRTIGMYDEAPTAAASVDAASASVAPPRPVSPPSDTDSDSDAEIMTSSSHHAQATATATHEPATVVDLTLTPTATRLDLDVAPLMPDGRRVTVRVLLNGLVALSVESAIWGEGEEEVAAEEEDTAAGTLDKPPESVEARELRRVLGLCEDIGVAAAWMAREPRAQQPDVAIKQDTEDGLLADAMDLQSG